MLLQDIAVVQFRRNLLEAIDALPQARYCFSLLCSACKSAAAVEILGLLKHALQWAVTLLLFAPDVPKTLLNANANLCSRLVAQYCANLSQTCKLRALLSLARNDFKLGTCHSGQLVKVVYDVLFNHFKVCAVA